MSVSVHNTLHDPALYARTNAPRAPERIETADDALAQADADTTGGSVRGDTHEQTIENLEASRELALERTEASDIHQVNDAYDQARAELDSEHNVQNATGDVRDILERAGAEDNSYETRVILRELEGVLRGLSVDEKTQVFEALDSGEVRDLGEQIASTWNGGHNAPPPLGQGDLFRELAEGMSQHRLASLTIGLTREADAAAAYLGRVIGEQGGQRAVDYVEQIATWEPASGAMDSPDQYATAIAETLSQLEGEDLESAVSKLDDTRLDIVMQACQETNGPSASSIVEAAAESSDPVFQARVFRSAGESLSKMLDNPGDYGSQIISTRNAMADLLASNPNAILNELRPTEQNSTDGSPGMDDTGRSLVALNEALLIDSNELNYRNTNDANNQQRVGYLISQISEHGQANGVPDDQIAANLGFFTGAAGNALENRNIDARDGGDETLVNLAVGLAGEIPYPGVSTATAIVDEIRDGIRQDQLESARESNQGLADSFVSLALGQVPSTADRSDANTEKFNEYFSYTRSTQLGR